MLASILVLACLSWTQEVATLLPGTPPGWRTERLGFPLSFAPELELEGFEDLCFAPGMFEPDSDSYFSYVLGLRLEGDVEVDEAFLHGFLATYYRGLCRSVAEGRGLTFDPASFSVEVQRVGEGYTASVFMIDPFVSGEPLELFLELEARSAPRCTELLGLASPLDAEAPIWAELRAQGERWRAARTPALFLNHVYFVPDRATFEALASSEFLRRFALVEQRETVRRDASYEGLYLYGRRTYFEFLPPGSMSELVEGASGLAFGLETPGGTADLTRRLEERGVRTMGMPVTRRLGTQDLPWFQLLGVEMPSAPLTLFSMEYEPAFLAGWHPELAPVQGGITRARILERYAASLQAGALRADAPFLDVSEVRLALDDAQRERVLSLCLGAGYELEEVGEETLCHAPQFRLRVQRSAQPGGVLGITLDVRGNTQSGTMRFGRAELTWEGETATFSFGP